MTTVTELIHCAKSFGARLWMEGKRLELDAPADFPDEVIELLRQHKAEIMAYLSQQQKEAKPSPGLDPTLCHNPLTPHSAHEYPWECDPNTCDCYREFGYPRLCQGVPCRWVWPDGIPGKMGAS